tara:strand:+ start:655 stop:792 length:138 start_codon:yes stop_codon:yes gene_type:complete
MAYTVAFYDDEGFMFSYYSTNDKTKVDKLLKRFKGNSRLVKGRIR